MTGRDLLLDVSRLIWRRWSRRLPTGIDRVCLEYVKYFGPRSHAVVQYKGSVFVLSPAESDHLFNLVSRPEVSFRRQLMMLVPLCLARGSRSPPMRGMVYLNIGHTGLERPGLSVWIARQQARAVYLVHDLIPITHPQYCRPGEAAKHQFRMRHALTSAAGLVCNSQDTLNALREFSRSSDLILPPNIVAWISSTPFSRSAGPKTPGRPYFVTIGTIEGRKNHLLLLKVWQSLAVEMGDETPILVIIGQRGWEAEEAISILDEAKALNDSIVELSRCDDEELAAWLGGAKALLMPSFVEGFGLPVIEALRSGVPVIASDLPVYREIAGNIPTYVDPFDLPEWESQIRNFIADGPERGRQLTALPDFRAPDWRSHFMKVEAWLDRL